MDEILTSIGINNKWYPTIEELNLHDPNYIRKVLLGSEYEEKPISVKDIKQMCKESSLWRYIHVKDSEIKLEKTMHSFTLYFTGWDYWKRHPEYSLTEVVFDLKKGKSNKKEVRNILSFAEL